MNDQAIMEARIADLEEMLKRAVVIDESDINKDSVNVGSSVDLEVTTADGAKRNLTYKIVGSNEANPREGKISDESAVGKALIGKKAGESAVVETPRGSMTYTVLTVTR